MCAFIFTTSPSKFVHHPSFCSSQPSSAQTKKRITGDKILFQHTIFWAILNRPFFLFFCHRGFLRPRRGLCFEGKPQREYLFSVSHTSSVSSLFASRDASTSTIRTYTHTQHNSSKMFSLTQSASFCAGAKVNVAAQKKQQSKISRSIQAGKAISSESLSKRDFLSAAVLSFGFLSVGDANAATKRVRKSSSSSAARLVKSLRVPPRKSPPRNPRTSRKGKPSSRRRPSRRRLRRDEAEEVCQSPGNPPLFPRVREKPDRRRKRERASINKFNDTLHMKDDEMRSQKERERESARFPL